MTREVQETAVSPGKKLVWHSSAQFVVVGVANPSTVYACPNLYWGLRRIDCSANDSTSLSYSNQFRKLQQVVKTFEKHPPTTPFRSSGMQQAKKSTSKQLFMISNQWGIMKSSWGS